MKNLALFVLLLCTACQAQTAFPNLLTGQTPFNHTVPATWTQLATENFEAGTCNSGATCSGQFNSIQFHNDGNPADTHSLYCPMNDPNSVSGCVGGGLNWNKAIPVGTGEVYASFYTFLDSSFRQNDEMFRARFHWDVGNGFPIFREAILDYFQDSTGTYNSTDAELLWNIQGKPYYQNKLPSNTVDGIHNYTIATNSWLQTEIYAKYSTITGTIAIPGTVTVSASAKTYTRTSGSWIADGVIIGSVGHFVGFTNPDNNGDGSSGGGGNSYFVTAVTDTVMTVYDPTNRLVNEGPVSNLTYQIDKGDGAYALYENGVLIAFQNNMVLPGNVDFSSQPTILSLMESYSKLIWRAPVAGACETKAPFTGTCASSIGNGNCGYETIPLGWNGSGFTRSVAGGAFDTPIDCSTAASGPMPNPPAFNRYVDDIIVLTRPRSVTTPPVAPATLTAGTDTCGNAQQTVAFPGYAQFTLDSGTTAICGAAGTSGQGITSYFDLKNDPSKQWDFGAADTGMFEHQWGIKNQDGTTRYNEIKEGPMAITVTESNNVRVKLSQSGPVRSVGLLTNTADCCMTMTKTYVFYRHGGATTGSGASKVFTQTTINYNNGDSQAPLTTAGTSTGINYYDKMGWWKVSGEVNNQTNPCITSSLQPFTLSPWNIIYPGTQGSNTNKDYILYAPVDANDSHTNEFLPAAPCTSPGNINAGPEVSTGPIIPGTIMLCNGASSTGCTSQSNSNATVRANFLQIENEQQCSFMSVGTQNYFLGGLRTYCALSSQTFPANTPRSWTSVGFIGDNGVTSDGSAAVYVTEYKTPPTITFTTGSGGTFSSVEGYWTIAAASNATQFSANGVMHSPAFLISSFTAAVPTNITVGSSTLVKDTNYVAVATDSTHLLLQILQDVPASTTIQIGTVSGPTVTVTPATASIPVLGQVQFTGSPLSGTWTAPGCSGSVASTGIFTASSTPETCIVNYTVSGNTGSGTVTVGALTVSPATVTLNVGATQQFSSTFASTWTASCGSIGSSSGLYTAPLTNGTCTITATAVNGGKTATATVTVTGQQTLIPLQVSPTSWNQTTTTSTTISNTFTASNIGTGSVTPTVTLTGPGSFSIFSNTCTGAVSGGGNCTVVIHFNSASAGTFGATLTITDTAGGNNNMPISISIPGGTPVVISPKSAVIPVSGTQQFTATPVGATFTTSVGCPGSVGASSGLFTASSSPGGCIITATLTGSTDTANLSVSAFTVNPVSVTLQFLATQQFTANFAATWSVTSGTCTVNAAGLLTAPASPGSCTVTATAVNGGTTATGSVAVVSPPPGTVGGKHNANTNAPFN